MVHFAKEQELKTLDEGEFTNTDGFEQIYVC